MRNLEFKASLPRLHDKTLLQDKQRKRRIQKKKSKLKQKKLRASHLKWLFSTKDPHIASMLYICNTPAYKYLKVVGLDYSLLPLCYVHSNKWNIVYFIFLYNWINFSLWDWGNHIHIFIIYSSVDGYLLLTADICIWMTEYFSRVSVDKKVARKFWKHVHKWAKCVPTNTGFQRSRNKESASWEQRYQWNAEPSLLPMLAFSF